MTRQRKIRGDMWSCGVHTYAFEMGEINKDFYLTTTHIAPHGVFYGPIRIYKTRAGAERRARRFTESNHGPKWWND